MIVYSLATQSINPGAFDVTLYLTKWQAYEALAGFLMPWDEDDPAAVAEAARFEALNARLHAEGATREIVGLFEAALEEMELDASVAEHDHPWTFPDTSANLY